MSILNLQSVLYIDDDPDVCHVVQATLRSIPGLSVHTATSGEQAIDLAYELRPDLVLMDVMMPGLDGPSTLKRLRAHALLENIPVIFITAKALPAEVAHFLKLGAIGVIAKPFDPLKLCDNLFAVWKTSSCATREINGTRAGQARMRRQIASMTESFLQRIRNDVIRLTTVMESARHGDRSALKELEVIAHSIHGAGAMFGFLSISDAGAAIELLVESIGTTTAGSGKAVLLQQLQDRIAQLAQEIDTRAQPRSGSTGRFQGRCN
jgi:CheY-like chemotaxis protein